MNTFQNAFSDAPVKAEPATDDKPDVETPEVETPDPAAPSAAKEPLPEAEKPKEEGQPRESNGKFAKTVPHEALHAERKRREALESELAELRKAQVKPPTSVLEDEDKAFGERLSAATKPIMQRFFNLSIATARRVAGREDFDDIYQFVSDETGNDPGLMARIQSADDPGEFIYTEGRKRKLLAETEGDVDKIQEKAAAPLRAELAKAHERIKALEAAEKLREASTEKRAQIPQSTNAEPSGTPKDDVFAGPRSLKSVFGS